MNDVEDIVDAEDVSTALVAPPNGGYSMLVRPIAPTSEIVEAIRAFEETKKAILTPEDSQQAGENSFVKKRGWAKLAVAFGVSSEIKDGYPLVVRGEDDQPIRATCIVVAVSPGGRRAEGFGACSLSEPRFTTQSKYRRKADQRPGLCNSDDRTCPLHYQHGGQPIESARQKLEHDLPSTAETRARNRAYSALFGHGEVSAEEIDAGGESMPWGGDEPPSPQETARNSASTPRIAPKPAPRADVDKPASDVQISSIIKLHRLIHGKEDMDYDPSQLTSAQASQRITSMNAEYAAVRQQGRANPNPPAGATRTPPAGPSTPAPVRREIAALSVSLGLPEPTYEDMSPADAQDHLASLKTMRRGRTAKPEVAAPATEADKDSVLATAETVSEMLDVAPYDVIGKALIALGLTDREIDDLSPSEYGAICTHMLGRLDEGGQEG